MSDEIYYLLARTDRYMLAVLIALVLMVILVYVVAIYYMRRKERAFVSSQAEMIRRTMLLGGNPRSVGGKAPAKPVALAEAASFRDTGECR